MIKLDQSQKIIIFLLLLFFIGASYLFSIDTRYNSQEYSKNWFSLAFSNPKSDKLDFVIENFSSAPDFHWEILAEKEKLSQGDVRIEPQGKQEIIVADGTGRGPITIRVSSSQNDALEIYKK